MTLIGSTVWVFGGRPADTRSMMSTLWALDLPTLKWSQAWPTPDPSSPGSDSPPPEGGPRPRYFHSATGWGDRLVIFGGQAMRPDGDVAEGAAQLETLADLAIWDTAKSEWSLPELGAADGVQLPASRYAHLAVVSEAYGEGSQGGERAPRAARLSIIGGQDNNNAYLSSMHVLDLDRMEWVGEEILPTHVGTYRSVASAAEFNVTLDRPAPGDLGKRRACSTQPRKEDFLPTLLFTNAGSSE